MTKIKLRNNIIIFWTLLRCAYRTNRHCFIYYVCYYLNNIDILVARARGWFRVGLTQTSFMRRPAGRKKFGG